MKKGILYGVQTTGNGHLVRSRDLVSRLKNKEHQIHTLFSGDKDKHIPDLELFHPYTRKRGLTFITKEGKISYLHTIKQLDLYRFYADIRSFDASGFQLAITDYEPIVSRIAKQNGILSLGMGHMYSFCYDVPLYRGGRGVALRVMNNFAPVDIPLGMHWHHFGQPLLPPMIPADIKGLTPTEEKDLVVVYLHFENLEQVKSLLFRFPEKTFHIYTRTEQEYEEKNIRIKYVNRNNFITDLAKCEGVICNAGFSLLSEALHLGKKVLAKPVQGQIEQESNALALEKLELGTVMHGLDQEVVRKWFRRSAPEPQNYPEVAETVVDWVDRGKVKDPKELSEQLWRR